MNYRPRTTKGFQNALKKARSGDTIWVKGTIQVTSCAVPAGVWVRGK